ncbi:MAG: DDE-type integrase/transposase/recombinase [Myxococcales bacterium]|nr:DDE-type integrase/transposase/recombinase [Myxococcales bacterium]
MAPRRPLVAAQSPTALFRYRVLSELRVEELRGCPRSAAVRFVAGRVHLGPDGSPRRVSERTLYRWLATFEPTKLESLEPASRPHVETSAVLPERLVDFLRSEKKNDSAASIPEILQRAEVRGVIPSARDVDRVTVWRAAVRMGLPTRQRPSKRDGDTRRFAYPHRMMMTLADGKYFRAGKARLRRVAIFFIDDATRYALDVHVLTSEHAEGFLEGVFDVLTRVGFMGAMYLDGGPGFIANDTTRVFRQLNVALIHGEARYPEGHGKIERFNQTSGRQVLRGLDGAADVNPDCRALRHRLRHFLQHRYNDTPHESLEGQTPRERWLADARELVFPKSADELAESFIVTESRRVSNDHVIQYAGAQYEVPRGLARQKVHVRRHVFTGELSLLHQGRIVTLHPVDLAANARARRGERRAQETHECPPIKTAAQLAYERDHGPIVDSDGGFHDRD